MVRLLDPISQTCVLSNVEPPAMWLSFYHSIYCVFQIAARPTLDYGSPTWPLWMDREALYETFGCRARISTNMLFIIQLVIIRFAGCGRCDARPPLESHN